MIIFIIRDSAIILVLVTIDYWIIAFFPSIGKFCTYLLRNQIKKIIEILNNMLHLVNCPPA